METTEKIVEAYCHHVLGWFTISNVRCPKQHEIDLLAIDPTESTGRGRYHIESGVSISRGYSKLTAKEFSPEKLKRRLDQAGQRRTVGYFIHHKFEPEAVVNHLKEYGFAAGQYNKVIVTWGWTEEAERQAKDAGILLWDFRQILNAIAEACRDRKTYFVDDTLRTIQLLMKSL